MSVLNLYSGLGGNRQLWKGVKVTAVEQNKQIAAIYQSLFPKDKVMVADAHHYLLNHCEKYDFIWSSPPCQSHSKMTFSVRGRYGIKKYPDMALYQEILYLKHFFKGHWVVENVRPYYAPLIPPTAVLGRHCFWADFEIKECKTPSLPNFIETRQGIVQEWLGIHFDKSKHPTGSFRLDQAFRNCVHPEIGLAIFKQVQKKATMTLNTARLKSKAIRIKQKQLHLMVNG